MADEIQSIDELQYDWPPNIVSYDVRYFLGLTMNDLMAASMCMVMAGSINIFLFPLGALLGLFLVKRFAALGDRRAWEYLAAMLLYRLRRRPVTLPRILPKMPISGYKIADLDLGTRFSLGTRSDLGAGTDISKEE